MREAASLNVKSACFRHNRRMSQIFIRDKIITHEISLSNANIRAMMCVGWGRVMPPGGIFFAALVTPAHQIGLIVYPLAAGISTRTLCSSRSMTSSVTAHTSASMRSGDFTEVPGTYSQSCSSSSRKNPT